MLVSNGHKLYFYCRFDNLDSKNRMEIDFMIFDGHKINPKVSPIEVKSSSRYTLKSLEKFYEKLKGKIEVRYVVHNKDLNIEGDIVYLLVYIVNFL